MKIFTTFLILLSSLSALWAQSNDCNQLGERFGEGADNSVTTAELIFAKTANDIVVEQGQNFTLESVLMHAISLDPITKAKITIYDDLEGLPNNVIYTQENILPNSAEELGYYISNLRIYKIDFDIIPFTLQGSADGDKRYWVQMELQNTGESTDWSDEMIHIETSTDSKVGLPIVMNYDDGLGWAYEYSDPAGLEMDGIISFYGECEEILGISDTSISDFEYFPNPVKNLLNFKSDGKIKSVSVYNLAGQKVISNSRVTNGQMNLVLLPAGTYVFRAELENGQIETFKIMKK